MPAAEPKHLAVRPVSAAALRSAASDPQPRSVHSAASARLDSKIEDLRAKRSAAVRDYAGVSSKSFAQQRHLQAHATSSSSTTTSTRQQPLSKTLDRSSASTRQYVHRREELKLDSNQSHAQLDWSPKSKSDARSLTPPPNGAGLADSSAELSEIQQSVQRLRAQRAHVEQLRHHNERLERLADEQQRANEQLRAELETLRGVEQENVGLLQSFKLLEERLRSLELACHEKRQELKAAHDKTASAELQSSRLEAEMQALERAHEQRTAALRAKQTTLVDRIRQLERDQDAFVAKQQRLELLWRDKVQHARQEARLEQQDCRGDLEQARKENAALAGDVAQLDAQVQALLATTARQTSVIEDCDRALSDAKAQHQSAKASYHDQLERNGRLQEQLQHAEAQLSAAQVGGESDRVACEKRVFVLESKLAKRKDRLEVLQVALHERDKQLQALQREAATQHRTWEHIEEANDDLRRREKTLLSEVSELRVALGDATDEKKIFADQVQSLQDQLEVERKDRSRWATARLKLLAEFCDEENKLSSALRFRGAASSSLDTRWSRDDLDADADDVDADHRREVDAGAAADDAFDDDRRLGSIVFG